MRIQLLLLMTGWIAAASLAPRSAGTAPPPQNPPGLGDGAPRLALLATAPSALHTSLYHVDAATGTLSAPLSTVTHLPDAVVRGTVLPGTEVVVATCDTREGHDQSFNASLFRLAPHTPPERLVDRVVHASRPLVTRSGRVFVSRGEAGPEETGPKARMRTDALSIDEIDPMTGAVHTVHTFPGYVTFLAGALGAELIVYRVSSDGADITGIDMDTGETRAIVARLPPFARDFSVDEESFSLVFQNRHEAEPRKWTVTRIDLSNGAQAHLYESPDMNLVPFVFRGGEVAFNTPERRGLTLSNGDPAAEGLPEGGVDWVISTTANGRFAAGLHTRAGLFPAPFVLDTHARRAVLVTAPSGTRAAVLGFVSAEGGEP